MAVEVTGEGNVCGNHYSVSSDSTVVFTAATLHTKNEKKKNLKTEILLGDICTVLEDIKNY